MELMELTVLFGRIRAEVLFEIDDARGNVVADETINLSETTTLSFQTDKGPKGNWFVRMIFTGFEGEGECSLGPA